MKALRFLAGLPLVAAALGAAGQAGAGEAFRWFAAGDLIRIFEDGYGSPAPKHAVELSGLRGETVSGQCVLEARSAVADAAVEISRLTNESGAVSLAAGAARWNVVRSVPVPQNTPAARMSHLTRPAPARFPDHRQNVFRVEMSSVRNTLSASGTLSFDFSRFDRWAEIFWKTGVMDRLETGFVGRHGPKRWYDSRIVLHDYQAEKEGGGTVTVPAEEYLAQFLPAFERHLRDKGWLEKTLFHIADEPAEWAVAEWRKAARLVHRYAPSLRRIDAIEATGFGRDLEVWVPKLPHVVTFFETYRKAQREGAELWYYLAIPYDSFPNRFVDFPLLETRILPWLNYRLGLTGFLHWGYNQWTDNPFEQMNRISVGAGDAWTVYPKKGGVLDSVRWEATRNGLQDYEYLWLLEDRVARIKARTGAAGEWIDPAQRGRELAGRVVRSAHEFTTSPEVLYETRAQVLREILGLERPPHLLVQTNPPEGSTILSGPELIELYGIAGPDTKVMVNGNQAPVDADGCFLTAVTLTPDRNVVFVKAADAKGVRTARRVFHVVH